MRAAASATALAGHLQGADRQRRADQADRLERGSDLVGFYQPVSTGRRPCLATTIMFPSRWAWPGGSWPSER